MTSTIVQHPLFNFVSELNLVYRPIELILAEHYRHRLMLQELQDLGEALDHPEACENARLIRSYLMTDLPQHEAFEEHDLVPLLKRRCQPSDNIDNLLAILMWDHFVDKDNAEPVNIALSLLVKGRRLREPDSFRSNVRRFSSKMKQHILWENRVILPLAKRRLSPTDLAELGERAAARRRDTLWPSMNPKVSKDLFSVKIWPQ